MNRKNMQGYQMLTRVAEFANTNVGLFPKNSAAAEIIEALESGVSELSEKASKRISAETAMRISRTTRTASRSKLRGYITRASWIATAMNSGKVQVPSDGTEQSLINSGHAFVEDVASISKDFARHGVGPEDVSSAVEALETAIRDYSSAKAARSAAIEESGKVLEETMHHLLRFDALVASYLEDNAGAMAAYNIARTVQRTKAHRTALKESKPAPAAPAPATTPAAAPAAHADALAA